MPVQRPPDSAITFQIVRSADVDLPYFWRIVGGNGAMLTYSSSRYLTIEACRAAVDKIRAAAGNAHIELLV